MQGVAWMKMAISYSSQDGIIVGVKKTFDGEHPCEMCCAIAKAKHAQEESEPNPALPPTKELKFSKDLMELGLVTLPAMVRHEIKLEAGREEISSSGLSPDSPPIPPPRCGGSLV